MKKSRFTENQIISILKEADSGMPMTEVLHAAVQSLCKIASGGE